VAGPFRREDLDEVAALVVGQWRAGLDRDWSAPAGTLEWSCARTADHTVDSVLAIAFFLASRKEDGYPEWGWGELTMGPDAPPAHLVDGLEAVCRVLSGVIATAPPGTRAALRRWPQVETGGPDDFAARGALELVLHGADVCAGLDLPLVPPTGLATRLRDHVREWLWVDARAAPPAVAPVGTLSPTDDPWSDLLEGTGRPRRTPRPAF
jgi:hypothetical protein